jgi:hypothetical protein
MSNLRDAAGELMRRGLFSGTPSPDVARTFLRNFKLIEAMVHRHLLVEPFFETDDELVEFLSKVLLLLHREESPST